MCSSFSLGLIDLGALEIHKDGGKKQGQFSAILFNQAWSVKKYNKGICLQGGRDRKIETAFKTKNQSDYRICYLALKQ